MTATAAAYAVHPHRLQVARPLMLAFLGLTIALVPGVLLDSGTIVGFAVSALGAVGWTAVAAVTLLERHERRALADELGKIAMAVRRR
jgi:hypothetical protein